MERPGSLQRGSPLSVERDFMPASVTALSFSGRLMTVANHRDSLLEIKAIELVVSVHGYIGAHLNIGDSRIEPVR